jgi:hypothetical protein
MTETDVIAYWREFVKEGNEAGWEDSAYDEYQFGQFLMSKSDYT